MLSHIHKEIKSLELYYYYNSAFVKCIVKCFCVEFYVDIIINTRVIANPNRSKSKLRTINTSPENHTVLLLMDWIIWIFGWWIITDLYYFTQWHKFALINESYFFYLFSVEKMHNWQRLKENLWESIYIVHSKMMCN